MAICILLPIIAESKTLSSSPENSRMGALIFSTRMEAFLTALLSNKASLQSLSVSMVSDSPPFNFAIDINNVDPLRQGNPYHTFANKLNSAQLDQAKETIKSSTETLSGNQICLDYLNG